MKLLLIWLFGVPLAVGVLCAMSALSPRQASVARSAGPDTHFEHVLTSIRQ